MLILWIALAGAGGTLLRYATGLLLPSAPDAFPWATLAVNVAGSFILAFAFRYLDTPLRAELRTTIAVGFCGAFTTFSTFGLETMRMMQEGKTVRAVGYVGASLALGLLAIAAGMQAGALMKGSR